MRYNGVNNFAVSFGDVINGRNVITAMIKVLGDRGNGLAGGVNLYGVILYSRVL